jgi:hypothetical protein
MNDRTDTNQARATLAEVYPALRRVTLFVAFEVADAESEPSYQQIIFTPDSVAAFRLDCSRDSCHGGGFDFTPVVDDLVQSGEAMVHGTHACAGTLGHGGGRCSLQAEYRIMVD